MQRRTKNTNKKQQIRWTYVIKNHLSPLENVKKLLAVAGLIALEFETSESFNQKAMHKFSISGVSMLGRPEYINGKLMKTCNKLRAFMLAFTKSDETVEEVLWQIDETQYVINKHLIENHELGYFLLKLPNRFQLHSLSDRSSKEVTLHEIILTENIIEQINQHLSVRANNFKILNDYISLLRSRVVLDAGYKPSLNPLKDTDKEVQLLEIWISLQQLGFLSHATAKSSEMAKLRAHFFEIFQVKNSNYKQLRQHLLERKNPEPKFLPKLIEAFLEAAKKKK